MEKIRVSDLTFQYPLADHPALSHVDLSIGASEFMVLCGKSGCGKSTLLRHLKKSLAPYGERSGAVYVDGVSVEETDDRVGAASVGFVQQNPDNQLVTDKVWHELAFGLENLGLPNPVIKRRVAEMASYFGIQNWFRRSVAELSGGQKQLLNLASVMAMQPDLLVLDEPASQLDPIAAADFLNTVYKINRDLGTTVVISEHRLEDVFPMADRVIVMDSGSILTQGTPSEVGRALEVWKDGAPHPMYFGMPAVMKAFPASVMEKREAEGLSLPLTLREGRLLAEELLAGREIPEAEEAPETAPRRRLFEKDDRDAAVSIKDLWFRYSKESSDVLRGLTFTIEKGKVHCLLGGNGSGKSTLLKALAGIVKPQRGKILKAEGLTMALVPQDPQALFTEILVEDEMLEGMAYLPLSDEEKVARTEELLALMEIEHLRKANPYDLSGGEQQRLAIGKVMGLKPDILLLDEPTKGLDPFFKRTMGGILRQLAGQGVTVLMVSHDIDFCARYGDICAMFFDGEITSEGSAREFFRGNSFYTTTANKLVRRWRNDIILSEEVAAWLETVL